MDLNKLLYDKYGYKKFKKGQKEAIESILMKNDTLVMLPTNGGKSLCYQLASCILDGVTIVVSPLISLMKDQEISLENIDIESAYINSSLNKKEYINRVKNIKKNKYKLIYVSPERLELDSFLYVIRSLKVSMIAIDEAHCISEWGHDFRPSYLNIPKFIKKISHNPVISCFTASATPRVLNEIVKLFDLKKPVIIKESLDRENIFYQVVKPNKKYAYVNKYLKRHISCSGIVYCRTRKECDSLAKKLSKEGLSVKPYHGGLNNEARIILQQEFSEGKIKVLIATKAFGLGIDKKDVRFVIHYTIPQSIESYYNESGRAGRDGTYSECILLYNEKDVHIQRYIIQNSKNTEDRKKRLFEKFNFMINYCHTDICLRKFLLSYFFDKYKLDYCGSCTNCNNNKDLVDITGLAKEIIKCVDELKVNYGVNKVTSILLGSKQKSITDFGLDKLNSFGKIKEYNRKQIRNVIKFLISKGYLIVSGGQYPVLEINRNALESMEQSSGIFIRSNRLDLNSISTNKNTDDKTSNKNNGSIEQKQKMTENDKDLFNELKKLRDQIAKSNKIPHYIIFNDRTLRDMTLNKPNTKDSLLDVYGVGNFKLNKYGDLFLDVINSYSERQNNNITKIRSTFNKIKDEVVAIKKDFVTCCIKKEQTSDEMFGYEKHMDSKEIDNEEEEVKKTILSHNNNLKLLEEIHELYLNDYTLADISEEKGISEISLIKILRSIEQMGAYIEWSRFLNDFNKESMIISEIKKLDKLEPKEILVTLPSSINEKDILITMYKYNLDY